MRSGQRGGHRTVYKSLKQFADAIRADEWGTDTVLQAISNALDRQVVVWDDRGQMILYGKPGS
eukprot:2917650-Rhodomonas_salina.1